MNKKETWIPKQCPRCEAETREDQGARGVAPVLHIEKGWRCCNPFCDIAGYLIFQDYTNEHIERLAGIKRESTYFKRINEARDAGRNPFFGAYEQYMKR